MSLRPEPRRSLIADSIYGLLNPVPCGCFVAALIFDILYMQTAVILWDKAAAWLSAATVILLSIANVSVAMARAGRRQYVNE